MKQLASVLCLAIGCMLTAGCGNSSTTASPTGFEGTWDGKYESHKGEKGAGLYVFHKEKDGQFDVTVSWNEGKEKMELKGERLGPDAIRLEGKHGDTKYWYIGRMDDRGLVLRYLSVEGTTGTSGSGVSTLTRQKK